MGITEFLIILVAFGSFTTIFLVLRQKASKQDMAERVKSAGATGYVTQAAPSRLQRARALGQESQAGVSELFSLPISYHKSGYKIMFEQAGWSPRNAAKYIIAIKLALVFGFMIPTFLAVTLMPKLMVQPIWLKFIIVMGAGVIGFLMFDRVMKFIINQRYSYISKDLPSAMELLVVCSKAGMSIEKSMERVAKEIGLYNKELGREFLMTAVELEVMPNRRMAYANLRSRVNLPLIHGLATTLTQAEEQGSSISDSLRVLSEEFRTQVLLDFERRAAKLPATLSIPVVLFTLPTLMAVILGPAIIKLGTETGWF